MCLVRNPCHQLRSQSKTSPSLGRVPFKVNMSMQISDNHCRSRTVPSVLRGMSRTYNLFKSSRGIGLPLEVCLRIIEDVVDIEPKYVRALMCLSKGFYSLIKLYEYSITKRLSAGQNIDCPIRPSLACPDYLTFTPLSYPWLSEIRSRAAIANFLARHDASDLSRLGLEDASDRPTKPQRLADRIKEDVLLLMYQLVDSTSGLKKKHSTRASQVEFLELLSPLELAKLGYFVKALGLGYAQDLEVRPERIPENSMRERICVFEDKTLRYGPYFAWAVIAGTEKARRWGRIVMLEGLNELEAFEKGQCRAHASLQSVVWTLFCKKAECDMADSWTIMREMIDGESDYDLSKT